MEKSLCFSCSFADAFPNCNPEIRDEHAMVENCDMYEEYFDEEREDLLEKICVDGTDMEQFKKYSNQELEAYLDGFDDTDTEEENLVN